MPKAFLACTQIHNYYNYRHQYEFTLTPLNHYERQKIIFALRNNMYMLDKLDNCEKFRIDNKTITKYITVFSLSGNRLKKLPPLICKLRLLNKLYLHFNDLTNLPSNIKNLKFLTYLGLYENQLTDLSSFIGHLKSLEWINIAKNYLTDLPSSIGNLKSLRYICLNNNQISDERLSYIRSLLPNCYIE